MTKGPGQFLVAGAGNVCGNRCKNKLLASIAEMSRHYVNAAKALEAVERGQSFKAYCAKQTKFGKIEFALASEALKFNKILNQILSATKLTGESLDVNEALLKVMVFDLLFGKKGKIDSGGVVKRKIVENKDALTAALNDLMKESGVSEPRELLPNYVKEVPKFVRINSLKIDNDDDGLKEIQKSSSEAKFDTIISSLVALPAGARSFGEHPWVKDGRLIIQDKSSCFSSQCCVELWRGGDIVDACAAPGNKTTHMAALVHRNKTVKKKAKIFAFDKSPIRCDLLQRRVVNAGADPIIEVSQGDFLSVDVSADKYKNVRNLLVDPSCSGSGILAVDRVAEVHEEDGSVVEDRLQKLRTFQISAIRKAMTFPNAEVVVYSTCSIHTEENESVVAEVLSGSRQQVQEGAGSAVPWKVVEPRCLSSWKRRGVPFEGLTTQEQNCLIRCDPSDGQNGFFVAVFVKDDKKVVDGVNNIKNSATTSGLGGEVVGKIGDSSGDGGNKIEKKRKLEAKVAVSAAAAAAKDSDVATGLELPSKEHITAGESNPTSSSSLAVPISSSGGTNGAAAGTAGSGSDSGSGGGSGRYSNLSESARKRIEELDRQIDEEILKEYYYPATAATAAASASRRGAYKSDSEEEEDESDDNSDDDDSNDDSEREALWREGVDSVGSWSDSGGSYKRRRMMWRPFSSSKLWFY